MTYQAESENHAATMVDLFNSRFTLLEAIRTDYFELSIGCRVKLGEIEKRALMLAASSYLKTLGAERVHFSAAR